MKSKNFFVKRMLCCSQLHANHLALLGMQALQDAARVPAGIYEDEDGTIHYGAANGFFRLAVLIIFKLGTESSLIFALTPSEPARRPWTLSSTLR